MRTLAKNKVKMHYALLLGDAPTYVLDEDGNPEVDYVDDDGIVHYLETGESKPTYSSPEKFFASISMSGSEAEAKEYGLSIADYEAVLAYDRSAFPFKEGDLIWHESEVQCQYAEEVEIDLDGNKVITNAPIEVSADYRVLKISNSLNQTKAILKAINK